MNSKALPLHPITAASRQCLLQASTPNYQHLASINSTLPTIDAQNSFSDRAALRLEELGWFSQFRSQALPATKSVRDTIGIAKTRRARPMTAQSRIHSRIRGAAVHLG